MRELTIALLPQITRKSAKGRLATETAHITSNPVHSMIVAHLKISAAVVCIFLLQGCSQMNPRQTVRANIPIATPSTTILAVYEPWFGHPRHISVGYSSQDPAEIRKQIDQAKSLGISGFVIDWYGDREPFLDHSYALIQSIAAEKDFKVSMMYDETEKGDTDEDTEDALEAFSKFQHTYLAPDSPGRNAYLMYHGRPMIFIFPKGGHTDWNRVREVVNKWDPVPLLIYENKSDRYADQFDGFYAWVNPGKKGWSPDGTNWGEDYLREFYSRMLSKYPDKIAVGAAWAGFNDTKASWSLNRHISQRCGKTFVDTLNLPLQYFPEGHPLPFLVIATWNDYEEGTAIEAGIEKCK